MVLYLLNASPQRLVKRYYKNFDIFYKDKFWSKNGESVKSGQLKYSLLSTKIKSPWSKQPFGHSWYLHIDQGRYWKNGRWFVYCNRRIGNYRKTSM